MTGMERPMQERVTEATPLPPHNSVNPDPDPEPEPEPDRSWHPEQESRGACHEQMGHLPRFGTTHVRNTLGSNRTSARVHVGRTRER